jgi:hypothetical protein
MAFLHVVADDAVVANASDDTAVDCESVEVIRLNILPRIAVRDMALLHDEDRLIKVIQRQILLFHLPEIPAEMLPFLKAFLLEMQIVVLWGGFQDKAPNSKGFVELMETGFLDPGTRFTGHHGCSFHKGQSTLSLQRFLGNVELNGFDWS